MRTFCADKDDRVAKDDPAHVSPADAVGFGLQAAQDYGHQIGEREVDRPGVCGDEVLLEKFGLKP